MFKEYVEFEISVQPGADGVYPLSVHCAIGGDARGTLRLPTDDAAYQESYARLKALDTDEDILAQLGQTLFNAVFQGDVKTVYARAQGDIQRDPSRGLRIKLNLGASEAAVAALPWEFLYDPDAGPLSMLDAPIVRYLQQAAVVPKLKAELPLKVLLTGAQTPPVPAVQLELQTVRDSLADLERAGLVSYAVEEHLSSQTLQRRLREGFHIWHFIGHGGTSRDGKSRVLLFEDSRGDPEPVSAGQLNILLNRSGLRLVLLSACEGGSLEAVEPFRSVAPALMRAQVPAVVAMQFTVPEDATRAFAGEFYKALAEGFPIDACVTEGRKAVMGATGLGRPDWGIPVVYTRAEDGRLFDLPAAPAARGSGISIGGSVGGDVSGGPMVKDSSGTTINVQGVGSGNTVVGSNITTNVSTGGAQPKPADEGTAIVGQLQGLFDTKKRRYFGIQQQIAIKGRWNVDPSVTAEEEDLVKELRGLAEQIGAAGGEKPSLSFILDVR